jgi:hypothetical protein
MEKKKNVSIFDSAKSKPKATSSAKDKEVVTVRGLETTLLEFQFLKEQIADDEAKLAAVTDEIKQISKEKFVELYKQKKTNPNSFYIKDGSGCVMVIPTDRYISIKEEDRADELIEKYGDEAVTIDEKYYFNPEVLERNMAAIEKLIKDAKTISDADKQDLLIREVKYSISKGFIDRLLPYGNEMENVIDDVQPIITLKNCGGKMADGGVSDEGEFIANVYDDYDAEVGTTVSSMYADGGMTSRYEIEQEKDGTWMILDKQRGMYLDRWFETKKEAENYLFYKIREDNYPLPLTDFDRRIIDYAKGLPNNDNQDEKFYMAKGGISSKSVKKLIDEVRENGEFMDSYMVDESQTVSNAGEQESYIYNGKNYLITTWNERAENHLDGEESIDIDEDYKYALGGLFGSSRYNTGRSWHLDHARHNKKENYEKPMKYRKRRRI